ncbi:FAD-dependent oxidoreductase [Rhizorhabdus sp. FW153]|uniref:FAD-dependent oxidoreductase n=1 Tax=Rhizorhabdus sp. FW153 TaxID=3400216 RepID=UPI003CF0630F
MAGANRDKVGRRALLRQAGAAGIVAGLSACAPVGSKRLATAAKLARLDGTRTLVPFRATPREIVDVKCCLRPLRAAGPNLGTEMVGDTLVVHNYGHGGSGWSLSWGSADIAVGKAMTALPRDIAVVGCGIVGLTTAIVAQRAGLKVTIYARELIQKTRSFRASGSFTPDARVALAEPAGAAFGPLWEQMARLSWKTFRTFLGLPGNPVAFSDSFALSDEPIKRRVWPADPAITESWKPGGLPRQNVEFGHYIDRIRDIVPPGTDLTPEENPFPVAYAQRSSNMYFNFASYAHCLLSEFFERGGQFVMRDFASPAEFATLPQKVVIHSTGYAARDLWRDNTIIPVRGQTGWLMPQPAVDYGVRYKNISLLSKADGVVVMNNNPEMGDMLGVGDSNELPNRSAIEEGLAIIAPVLAAARPERLA